MKQVILCLIVALTIAIDLSAEKIPLWKARRSMSKIECQQIPFKPTIPKSSPNKSQTHAFSTNWSGYAAQTDLEKPDSNVVSMVCAIWQVPEIDTNSAANSAVAIWVGIDGFSIDSPSIQQVGIIASYNGFRTTYTGFVATHPESAFSLDGFPLNPNDLIGAEIEYTSNDNFDFYLMNINEEVYTKISMKVPGAKRNSAEWIIEAPTTCTNKGCSVTPLANFGTLPVILCEAKIDSVTGNINDNTWDHTPIIMVQESNPTSNRVLCTPLLCDDTGFGIIWEAP